MGGLAGPLPRSRLPDTEGAMMHAAEEKKWRAWSAEALKDARRWVGRLWGLARDAAVRCAQCAVYANGHRAGRKAR